MKQIILNIALLFLLHSFDLFAQESALGVAGVEEIEAKYERFVQLPSYLEAPEQDEAFRGFLKAISDHAAVTSSDEEVDVLNRMIGMFDSYEGEFAAGVLGINKSNVSLALIDVALSDSGDAAEAIIRGSLSSIERNLLPSVQREIESKFGLDKSIEIAIESFEPDRVDWNYVFGAKLRLLENSINEAKALAYNQPLNIVSANPVPDDYDFDLLYQYLDDLRDVIRERIDSSSADVQGIDELILWYTAYFERFFGCEVADSDQSGMELRCSDRDTFLKRRKSSGSIEPELETFILSHHHAAAEISAGAVAFDVISELYKGRPLRVDSALRIDR